MATSIQIILGSGEVHSLTVSANGKPINTMSTYDIWLEHCTSGDTIMAYQHPGKFRWGIPEDPARIDMMLGELDVSIADGLWRIWLIYPNGKIHGGEVLITTS